MDQLWAPWRIDYVARPNKADGCFLCEAARDVDDRQTLVLWRGENTICMLNRWPYNNGHIMVAPLEHKADLADLTEGELLEQLHQLRRCEANLKAVMHPEGFNIGLNLGEAGGAGVPGHLHWHIVPRWRSDTNFMPTLAGTKIIPQSLDNTWQLLREADGQGECRQSGDGACAEAGY